MADSKHTAIPASFPSTELRLKALSLRFTNALADLREEFTPKLDAAFGDKPRCAALVQEWTDKIDALTAEHWAAVDALGNEAAP